VQDLKLILLLVAGGLMLRIAYVWIARHYRDRGWPGVDRRKVSRRKIDRMEMNRLDREYGRKDREER
jgi:hypothetical protein